jgi:3',5'-cyclic AMP phosphodiesterase CpdA
MKPIRLLHLTDIHFRSVPKLRELTLKRTFGLINQFAMGRKDEFSDVVQLACIRKALQLNPSAVVISGDLTAMALESEFVAARQALLPLLNSRPSFVIPGNHDCYTQKAIDADLIGKYFGEFMHRQSNSLPSLELDSISIVGMNPCRPILLESTGYFPQEQMNLVTQTLQRQSSSSNVVILATHYPVLDRSSAPYHLKHPKHGVRNGQSFIDVVHQASAGNMILHGHDHHGFRQKLGLFILFILFYENVQFAMFEQCGTIKTRCTFSILALPVRSSFATNNRTIAAAPSTFTRSLVCPLTSCPHLAAALS